MKLPTSTILNLLSVSLVRSYVYLSSSRSCPSYKIYIPIRTCHQVEISNGLVRKIHSSSIRDDPSLNYLSHLHIDRNSNSPHDQTLTTVVGSPSAVITVPHLGAKRQSSVVAPKKTTNDASLIPLIDQRVYLLQARCSEYTANGREMKA